MESRKRFVHIIPPSKRMMNTYVKMIRDNFPMGEHTFMLFDRCSEIDVELFNYGNVEYLSESNNWLKRYKAMYDMYKKYDYIIWHGFIYGGMYMIFLCIFQFYFKKTVWVMRGIDLYNWKNSEKNIKKKVVNLINYYVRKKVPNVVAIFPTDIDIYKQQFKTKANIYSIPYPISKDSFEDMERISQRKPRLNGETWIQVCNNSYVFNNHLEILDYISKFNEENVKLFIPLSYGNDFKNIVENYPREVENQYTDKFGLEKVEILRRLIPIEEYTRLICNMDIAIFGAYRQNALGNILRQLYIGNRIFLSNKNPLYVFLRNIGIDISCMEDIPNMTFEEFSSEANKENSQVWMKNNFHPDYNYKIWNEMFKKIEKKKQEKIMDYFVYDIPKKNDITLNEDDNILDIHSYKSNFIQTLKYTSNNRGMLRNYNNLKNLYIIGDEACSELILNSIYIENRTEYKYIIAGILSNEYLSLKNIEKPVDVVGKVEDYLKNKTENDCVITAIEDPDKREAVVKELTAANKYEEDINCISLALFHKSNYSLKIGTGCCISSRSSIGVNTIIYDHTYIFDSKIGFNCKIGSYVTIKTECIICDNVIIKDKVTIGEGSIIYPNITISEGTIIPIGSIIKESI